MLIAAHQCVPLRSTIVTILSCDEFHFPVGNRKMTLKRAQVVRPRVGVVGSIAEAGLELDGLSAKFDEFGKLEIDRH